ncbi:MAG: UDP-N-acetylmuramate--L-alanine ligase [Bacteroidales bacterium]|nr:UDP-N-acetylmuramate--L-alanine ligase [Bacteroidales bacterium]
MTYYFIGIGGIGMSALARYLHSQGHRVSGYDSTETTLTRQLISEGIDVQYIDNPLLMPPSIDTAVYTPAVPPSTAIFQAAAQGGYPLVKRAQLLAQLTSGAKCIAIAGTHGKTTTSTLIAHLLHSAGIPCSALLGGISKNFQSNCLYNKKPQYIVVEADEYDRSFLQLHPHHSVITSTDPDHLDIYHTHQALIQAFQQYANQTSPDGLLLYKQGIGLDPDAEEHHHHEHDENHEDHHDHHQCGLELNPSLNTLSYTSTGIEADYYPWNLRNYGGNLYFDLRTPNGVLYDLQLTGAPLYNVENAVAASAIALSCGISEYQLRNGLKTFAGIQRRFDYHLKTPNLILIDDYAHHPREIEALISSVRYLYPEKRVVGVFQPHLYSRTRDLAPQFAQALSALDETILLPIYPAREQPIPGVSSALILRNMKSMNRYLSTPADMPTLLQALCPDIILTIGAAPVDQLIPDILKTLA